MADPIDFYFDFSSPYGYLASERIDALMDKHGRQATWRPILLGAVFKKLGTTPLISQPVKGPYSARDLERTAKLLGIAYRLPDPMPVNSVAACRAYYWLYDQDPAQAKALAHALYRGYFVDNKNLGDAEIVLDSAAALGTDRDALGNALQDQAVKDRLRVEVDAALERGIFGSPTVFVGNEMFWGVDRFDQIGRWLETGGW